MVTSFLKAFLLILRKFHTCMQCTLAMFTYTLSFWLLPDSLIPHHIPILHPFYRNHHVNPISSTHVLMDVWLSTAALTCQWPHPSIKLPAFPTLEVRGYPYIAPVLGVSAGEPPQCWNLVCLDIVKEAIASVSIWAQSAVLSYPGALFPSIFPTCSSHGLSVPQVLTNIWLVLFLMGLSVEIIVNLSIKIFFFSTGLLK